MHRFYKPKPASIAVLGSSFIGALSFINVQSKLLVKF